MQKLKITIVDGSPRKESETRKLVYAAKNTFEKLAVEVTVIDQGSSPLPFFDESEEVMKQPLVQNFFKAIIEADAIVLSSPEYHGSMSAALKNALDWLTFLPKEKCFAGKVVGLMGGGGSMANSGANLQMMMAVRNMHGWLLPEVLVSIPNIWDAFDSEGKLIDLNMQNRLDSFGQKLVKAALVFKNAYNAAMQVDMPLEAVTA